MIAKLGRPILGLVFAISLSSNISSAGDLDDVYLMDPVIAGTGCPVGSASATLSPDRKTLSILFDSFVAEAAGRVRVDRKNCSIAIPIHIPQGYSFSVVQLDYRGFNALPSGARSVFSVEYFLGAGGRGPRYSKTFYGPQDEEYLIRNALGVEAIVWSRCGTDTNLRTNASIQAITNSRGDQAMATLDSVDIEAGLIYQLQWKRCR